VNYARAAGRIVALPDAASGARRRKGTLDERGEANRPNGRVSATIRSGYNYRLPNINAALGLRANSKNSTSSWPPTRPLAARYHTRFRVPPAPPIFADAEYAQSNYGWSLPR